MTCIVTTLMSKFEFFANMIIYFYFQHATEKSVSKTKTATVEKDLWGSCATS